MSIVKLTSQEAYDRYDFAGLLGEGTMGMVYAGVRKSSNERVAIKTMTFAKGDYDDIVKEIDLLVSLRSKYVVSLVEALQFDDQLWIVMECCEGGAIDDIMKTIRSVLNEAQSKEVVAHVLLALKHCHSNNIIHRDIKAANVLLSHDGTAKLADFGISAELSPTKKKRTTVVGTPHFMSPEMIKGQSYDIGADVWSLGITLYELCEGEPPYFNKNTKKAHALIAAKASPKLKNPSAWSDECHDFLRLCLEQDVTKRPSVSVLLEHVWVKDTVESVVGQKSGDKSALKAFFDDNIKAIVAMRHQDDSSDESDNECDFDTLAEEEAARVKALQEAEEEAARRAAERLAAAELEAAEEAARLKAAEEKAAQLKATEEAAAFEAARIKAAEEAAALEAARIKAAEEEAARLKAAEEAAALEAARIKAAEEEAARLKAAEEAAALEAARLKAKEEAIQEEMARVKAADEKRAAELAAEQDAARQEIARLKAEQEDARLKAEQEAENVARMQALRQAAKDEASMKDDKVDDDKVIPRPTCFKMPAKKRNNGSFKMSDWKSAFFVLDEGVLKYFRSEADYRHNSGAVTQAAGSPNKALKKERRFPLSVHSKAELKAALSVEVTDSAAGWNVAIKCEDEASCRTWLNNIEAHVKYLKFIDEKEKQKAAKEEAVRLRADQNAEDDDEDDDEFDVAPTKMGEVATTTVNVNKFINKLRASTKARDESAMRRVSQTLTTRERSNSKALPCEMRGWVHKRTDHAHHWKKRFVIMENSVIKYFMTDKNKVPQGMFVLSEASTVHREGDIIKIEHISGTHDDGETVLSSKALAIKLDNEGTDWALETWRLAIQDNIDHSKNVELPQKLKRLSVL